MKKRRLRGFVLPTTYLLITITIFTGIIFMSRAMEGSETYDYSTGVIDETTKSVMEENTENNLIGSPVDASSVNINVYYYNKDDVEERQEKSLIYYENTYMPNSGVLYAKDTEFEVKSVYDGKITEIKDDEILGTYVTITHNNNLKTHYYGLNNLAVSLNDEVTKGTILGVSKENSIVKSTTSCLFEVYYKGETINPEGIINAKITDFA